MGASDATWGDILQYPIAWVVILAAMLFSVLMGLPWYVAATFGGFFLLAGVATYFARR